MMPVAVFLGATVGLKKTHMIVGILKHPPLLKLNPTFVFWKKLSSLEAKINEGADRPYSNSFR